MAFQNPLEHSSSHSISAEGFGNQSFEPASHSSEHTGRIMGAFNAVVKELRKAPMDRSQQLEIGSEHEKLKSMKQIIEEIARGNDESGAFPHVVKLVASKSLELRKLVYIYLVRYSEDLPDIALLSISTFQKGLRDQNQLIRASALRVLSSIRVPLIVPIMMLSLKQTVTDMSAYVRKTVAHAIPKLYSIAPSEKEGLVELIEKLLHDKTTLVVGSIVMAFEEVCPERLDLIHKHFRKFCNILVDLDEWGKIAVLKLLMRYARTQFLDPNQGADAPVKERAFYEDEDDEEEKADEKASNASGEAGKDEKKSYAMDADLRLLLTQAFRLVHDQNSGVVLAVVELFYYVAPYAEMSTVVRPLIHTLSESREVQFIVLTSITTMVGKRASLFEPYAKCFFVKSSDAPYIRMLKLEILTAIANESNIHLILREFQYYVKTPDKSFVAATIQCIGRVAARQSSVTESCMTGLMLLMNHRDENVVGESVVVIKKLLQMKPAAHKEIIVSMAKMASSVKVPMARASILWIIGEYSSQVPKIAPDVLRQMAKSFATEDDVVKLQIINLAAKLYVNIPKHTKVLALYVLSLAKYVSNYDIRDHARLVRAVLANKESALYQHAKQLFLSEKPAPSLVPIFTERDRYQVSSLSHILNMEVHGWLPIPPFPLEPSDPSTRNVEERSLQMQTGFDDLDFGASKSKKQKKQKKSAGFYSDEESSSDTDSSDTDSDSDSSGSSSSGSDDSSSESGSSDTDSEDSEDSSDDDSEKDVKTPAKVKKPTKGAHSDSSSESSSGSDSSSGSSDSSSEEEEVKPTKSKTSKTAAPAKTVAPVAKKPAQAEVNLLDLDFGAPVASSTAATIAPSLASIFPTAATPAKAGTGSYPVLPAIRIPQTWTLLLNKVNAKGLSVESNFTRQPSGFGDAFVGIALRFTNHSTKAISNIKSTSTQLDGGVVMSQLDAFSLEAGTTVDQLIGINFADSSRPVNFDLTFVIDGEHVQQRVTIEAPVGELVRGLGLTAEECKTELKGLSGMNEHTASVPVAANAVQKLLDVINVATVPTSQEVLLFAGQTVSSKTLVLIQLDAKQGKASVSCGNMVIGSSLLKAIKSAFAQ